MKKLFLTAFGLIAFIASAQDFSFGIKAGAMTDLNQFSVQLI